MIGKIKGIIDSVSEDTALVDVNGVGYVVFCTSNTLSNLEIGSAASFYIHMVVKEDQLTLYGFLAQEEKHWFNILQTVQGVGPKMAMSIIGGMSLQDIFSSILSEDDKSFRSISGVGPKLAARIVNELKGKKGLFDGAPIMNALPNKIAVGASNGGNDAISALTNLGFARKDVFPIVSEIQASNENISLEETIKIALSKLTGR